MEDHTKILNIAVIGHRSYFHDRSFIILRLLVILTPFLFDIFNRYVHTRKCMIILYKLVSFYVIKGY